LLAFENEEKEKRAAELVIANKTLAFENEEKTRRAEELIIANKTLAFENKEKSRRAEELLSANKELLKAEEYLKDYTRGLEEIMFMTSHKVRQPVANILGIVSILDQYINSPLTLNEMIGHLQESAFSLDNYTHELSTFILGLRRKKD